MTNNIPFPDAYKELQKVGHQDQFVRALYDGRDLETTESETAFEDLDAKKTVADAETITRMAADAHAAGKLVIHNDHRNKSG